MPSSMRPTTIEHRHARWSAPGSRRSPSPNAKAIGTPAKTVAADDADEEDQQVEVAERLAPPAPISQTAATISPATSRTAVPTSAPVARRSIRRSTREHGHQRQSRSEAPLARQAFEMLKRRRGDERFLRARTRRHGCSDRRAGRPAPPRWRATSRKARTRGDAMPTTRRHPHVLAPPKATTAPSMASHRNRIDATSSDQISGAVQDVARDRRRRRARRSRPR